jgi:hypothetical protein
MITDFEILKKQLTELAKVVNSFKSETVQLKVTELVLTGQVVTTSNEEPSKDLPPKIKDKKKVKKDKKVKKTKKSTKQKVAKVGPATILTELIDDGYFTQAHTIGDIIKHTEQNKARKLKANEFSGPLTRFVRDNRLKRKKNKDGQYEYKKA